MADQINLADGNMPPGITGYDLSHNPQYVPDNILDSYQPGAVDSPPPPLNPSLVRNYGRCGRCGTDDTTLVAVDGEYGLVCANCKVYLDAVP